MKLKFWNILIMTIMGILTIFLLPTHIFSKYKLEQVSQQTFQPNKKIYYRDLDNNGIAETIEFDKSSIPGNCINTFENGSFKAVYNLAKEEFFVSQNLSFADLNSTGKNEIFFVTVVNKKAYLNIVELIFNGNYRLIDKLVELDTVNYQNGNPDVINCFIYFIDQKVVLDLQAGFSCVPRNIYIYDYQNNSLIKSPKTSICNNDIKYISINNKPYFLMSDVFATLNSISFEQEKMLKNSTNPDDIALYKQIKDLVFEYGDFAAYTLLFNSELKFQFPPIPYNDWTKQTKSDFIIYQKVPHIITYVSIMNDTSFVPFVTITNFEGKIIKKINVSKNYTNIFVNHENNEILMFNLAKKVVDVFDHNFKIKKRFKDIDYIYGFKDIDNDLKQEFIVCQKNNLVVYTSDLKSHIALPLGLSGQNTTRFPVFDTFANNNQIFLNIQIDNVAYVLKYSKNKIKYLQIPIYIIIFGFWYYFIWLINKINSRRLEKENLRLEALVKERTSELILTSNDLITREKELIIKSDELKKANSELQELNNFKEIMVNTIVHDLKNPLNTIINFASDEQITQPAYKMLNLVLNVLDVSKYEKTKISLYCENILLDQIIDDVQYHTQFLLNEKNLRIERLYKTDVQLFADKEIITRVIENLLTNAIKFSFKNQKIEINSSVIDNNYVKIEIINFGEQIPKDKTEIIFEKYQQYEKVNSGSIKSSGLGLTFCKMAIEAHNGKIWIENANPNATKFIFTLPGTILNSAILKDKNPANLKYQFSDNEIEILKPLIEKLKFVPICELSDIINVLNDATNGLTSDAIVHWKRDIKTAIYSANVQFYNQLLNI